MADIRTYRRTEPHHKMIRNHIIIAGFVNDRSDKLCLGKSYDNHYVLYYDDPEGWGWFPLEFWPEEVVKAISDEAKPRIDRDLRLAIKKARIAASELDDSLNAIVEVLERD